MREIQNITKKLIFDIKKLEKIKQDLISDTEVPDIHKDYWGAEGPDCIAMRFEAA
jgi:hypothetical protein